MAKSTGIVALIIGIIAISPLNYFITDLIAIALKYSVLLWWLFPVLSILVGIIAIVTSKGDAKTKKYGMIGLICGAIGFPTFFVWIALFGGF